MIRITGTKIELTRGDTLNVYVKMCRKGEEYTPKAGDVMRFAMKKHYQDAEPVIEKIIPNDTQVLTLEPEDTKALKFGEYVYDIELTFADGTVDTFIAKATFVVSEEVH